MLIGTLLDRITPWLGRIALALFVIVMVILALNYASCSRQQAAQSKQDARSATAGTKTGQEALKTLEKAQERDADTDQIVAQGRKDIADAKTYPEIDAAGRAALCRMRGYNDHPACQLQRVHPK